MSDWTRHRRTLQKPRQNLGWMILQLVQRIRRLMLAPPGDYHAHPLQTRTMCRLQQHWKGGAELLPALCLLSVRMPVPPMQYWREGGEQERRSRGQSLEAVQRSEDSGFRLSADKSRMVILVSGWNAERVTSISTQHMQIHLLEWTCSITLFSFFYNLHYLVIYGNTCNTKVIH